MTVTLHAFLVRKHGADPRGVPRLLARRSTARSSATRRPWPATWSATSSTPRCPTAGPARTTTASPCRCSRPGTTSSPCCPSPRRELMRDDEANFLDSERAADPVLRGRRDRGRRPRRRALTWALLEGRTALVTGGAAGHRRRGVPPLRRGGRRRWRCSTATATARRRSPRRSTASRSTADVRDADAVTAAVRAAAEQLGGLTDLVANAGIGMAKPLLDYTDKEFALLVGVNLTGTFNAIRAAGPILRRGRRRQHRHQRLAHRHPADPGRGPVLGGQGRRDRAHRQRRARAGARPCGPTAWRPG